MSTPTLASPNVDNIQVGKGVVSFKKTGDSVYRDMGNISHLTVTPQVTTLEHFSSRSGTKKKDLQVILDQKCTAKIIMEEITAENLALMLYGNVDINAPGGPEVEIFGAGQITGALRFVGTNDIGPKVTVDLYNVSFSPTGDLKMISDEFNSMEVIADVLAAGGIAPLFASGIYTATTNFTDADTLTIGGRVYTIQASLTNVDGHVKLGVDLATSLANIRKAINLTGIGGTDYAAAMTINSSVSATSTLTTLTLTADVGGVAGNSITTTDTSTSGAFGAATLAGGVDGDPHAGKFGVAKFTNVSAS